MENMTTPAVHHNYSYGAKFQPRFFNEDYDKIYKSVIIMSMVIYSVVCVLGVLGNGVVIWATGFRMKKTVSTVWYLNLAVADFLVTAFLPLQITYTAMNYHWPFDWFMCKMDSFVFFVNMYASVFTLVVISVDRCVCVVCPVWTQNHRTVKKASWVSLGVWVIMALSLSIPHFIFSKTYRKVGYSRISCRDYYASTKRGTITNFLVGFVVPFSAIVSCYSVVIYRLRNNRSLASQSGRSFKIIGTVIATFFLCWAPFHITRLTENVTEMSLTLYHVLLFGRPLTLTLALVNSCVNPLLYMFMSQGLKDVFRGSILKVLEKAFAEGSSQTNNTPRVVTQMVTLSEIEGSTGPPGKP